MKLTVIGLIFLFCLKPLASSSIIALDYNVFTVNLICEMLSDIGFPTGDTFDIKSQHDSAKAYWFKRGEEYQRFNGEVINSETDPVIQKFVEITGHPLFGFKFKSPNEQDPSILRLVVMNDTEDLMPAYLILSVPNTDDTVELNEKVLLNQHAQCTYYDIFNF